MTKRYNGSLCNTVGITFKLGTFASNRLIKQDVLNLWFNMISSNLLWKHTNHWIKFISKHEPREMLYIYILVDYRNWPICGGVGWVVFGGGGCPTALGWGLQMLGRHLFCSHLVDLQSNNRGHRNLRENKQI